MQQFGSPNPDQVKTAEPRVGGPKNGSCGGEVLTREARIGRKAWHVKYGSRINGSNPQAGGKPEPADSGPL